MQFRLALVEDLPSIIKLEQTFDVGDRASKESYKRLLKSKSVWILESNKIIIGSAIVLIRTNSRIARLYSITVAENLRGQGLGKKIINEIVDKLKNLNYDKLSLEVKESNTQAWKLYESLDFEFIKSIENYYADSSAAKRYVKSLN
jgi:ribosomal protein S18 acetylase RimI-like enzyme